MSSTPITILAGDACPDGTNVLADGQHPEPGPGDGMFCVRCDLHGDAVSEI